MSDDGEDRVRGTFVLQAAARASRQVKSSSSTTSRPVSGRVGSRRESADGTNHGDHDRDRLKFGSLRVPTTLKQTSMGLQLDHAHVDRLRPGRSQRSMRRRQSRRFEVKRGRSSRASRDARRSRSPQRRPGRYVRRGVEDRPRRAFRSADERGRLNAVRTELGPRARRLGPGELR